MSRSLPPRAPRLFPSPEVKQESLFGVQDGFAAQSEAGRHCAFLALEALEPGFGQRGIGAGESGRIQWPAGVIGSITHARGFASAAVAKRERVRGIGLDSETLFAPHVAQAMTQLVYRPGEEEVLSGFASALAQLHGVDAMTLSLTLAFSIKESCLRCLHAIADKEASFQSFSVESLGESGEWCAVLNTTLGPELPPGMRLRGAFVVKPPYVHTGIALALN